MKIDFHTHTHHSYDSVMHPKKILKLAKKRGLDAIVINDHDTIKGGVEACQLNEDRDLKVIVGAEIRTDAGDITGIFLKEEIKAREVNKVIEEIKGQGGRVILNHPYSHHDLDKINFKKIDFIEGYNGRLEETKNEKAIKLARKHDIPILSGSDAHTYKEVARCWTIVEDLVSLKPITNNHAYSGLFPILLSQYIKSLKKRSIKVGIITTLNLIKYLNNQLISRLN
ncbi:MAG: PHP domain-containing protein [Ekhidna sp.]|nr:PHP domain-containing protein [Ekhidna sp.]